MTAFQLLWVALLKASSEIRYYSNFFLFTLVKPPSIQVDTQFYCPHESLYTPNMQSTESIFFGPVTPVSFLDNGESVTNRW